MTSNTAPMTITSSYRIIDTRTNEVIETFTSAKDMRAYCRENITHTPMLHYTKIERQDTVTYHKGSKAGTVEVSEWFNA